MGAADNRSYKDEYLFTGDSKKVSGDYPSIKSDPEVNTSIKKNPYRSNVEIEGGEIVLQPDLSALFKATGKRHSNGGMDVLLKPESFVFSDFKELALTEKDHEMFELKEGGTATPAQTLKKNVDLKHYNGLVTILNDPYKDDLAKKSAALMLEKYIQTIGNVAFIQEQKKGFPDGVPAFSTGTAPVYDGALKDEIMANKQYMKAGGAVGNPYMQTGGSFTDQLFAEQKARFDKALADKKKKDEADKLSANQVAAMYLPQVSKNPNSIITPQPQNPQTVKVNAIVNTPTQSGWGPWNGDKMPIFQDRYGVTNAADKFDRIKNWDDVTKQLGYSGPKNNLSFQKWLYNSSPENKAVVDKWHNKYKQGPNAGMFDSKIGIRWASALNEILDGKSNINTPNIDRNPYQSPDLLEDPLKVPNLEVTPQEVKRADWEFTPWQKIAQGYNAAQMANVKRYMPYRSRYNATYVDPSLVNPEQAVGDIKGIVNQQLSSLGSLNPIMRNAQAAATVGQAMNQIPGVRSQYDNQNAQIINQSRQYNNQVRNNESMINMSNDQTYYQQAVEGRKNFDNMRQFTSNNYMNNVLRDVETNQKLAYNLLTQNDPAYNFDWRTGNFTRTDKKIQDVQGNAVNDRYSSLLEMVNSISDPIEKAKLAVKLEGLKVFGSASNNTPNFMQKKGGKIKKNPYK